MTADKQRGSAFCWSSALVGLVMLCLVFSLATRTFHQTVPQGFSAHGRSAQAVRQHMDKDAVRWAPPVLIYTAQQPPVFYPHASPTGPPVATLLLIEDNLYKRPPPSC